MNIILYQQRINDKKHNITFDKDKVSYRGKTFDGILSKAFRQNLSAQMVTLGLHFPVSLELDDKDYFTKFVKYTRADGTLGHKAQVVILNARKIEQAEFESKSLDEVVDDIEQEKAEALAKGDAE